MSSENQVQIEIYLQLPGDKRSQLESEFRQLKLRFMVANRGGDVATLIQSIADVMMPKHLLTPDQFLGLAYHTVGQEYEESLS